MQYATSSFGPSEVAFWYAHRRKTQFELVFKHSNFGEVEGGSGKTSAGGTYNADEFDSIYNSIAFRIKY